jgi:hypothetical protein
MMKNLDMQEDEIFALFTNPRASSVFNHNPTGASAFVHPRLIFDKGMWEAV